MGGTTWIQQGHSGSPQSPEDLPAETAVAGLAAEQREAVALDMSQVLSGASEASHLCCRDTVIASNPWAPTAANATAGAKDAAKIPSPYSGVPLLPMRVKPAVNASWVDVDTPNRATCEVGWLSAHTSVECRRGSIEACSRFVREEARPHGTRLHASLFPHAQSCSSSWHAPCPVRTRPDRLTSPGVGMQSPDILPGT